MNTIWTGSTKPATATTEAVRIVISNHGDVGFSRSGFCTHVEVLPVNRLAFKVSGRYDMTLADAMRDAHARQAAM